MKNFFKLLNFELNRFSKLYFVLLSSIGIIQIIITVLKARAYLTRANNAVLKGGMTQHEFIEMYSKFSMIDVIHSILFAGTLAIGIAAILFYIFFIWYRDWFAKNTFVYRLLTLPTSRMNLFFTKVITIMMSVLGLVTFQLMMLNIEKTIVKWIIPKVYREDLRIVDMVSASEYLPIILPQGIAEFFIAYGLGLGFVVIVFTAILFERSFRLKGIIFGLLYAFISITIFILPITIQLLMYENLYLYPMELLFVQAVTWAVIVAASLLVSRYLLKNKVTV
ncbi:hypothetical protein SPD48_00770 [Pseudogracilibacillus sp. SE30717A]|uniref:hypothetical protein n=1 Tax=Pseudogracilibacillus sp. SE30717A TaxID=3098293 RepID=UPI00300DC640